MSKKIFSPQLFVQSLLRLKTLGIAMLISVVALNLFQPISEIMTGTTYVAVTDEFGNALSDVFVPRIYEVGIRDFAPFLWLMLVFAPLITYVAFSYLHNRSKSDFYHSLPQTRVCVYLSTLAAVLAWTLATVIATTCVNLFMWWLAPYNTVSATTVFTNLISFSVLSLFLTGLTAVSVMLTGTLVSTVLTFLWLFGFPPIASFMFSNALLEITDVIRNTSTLNGVLSMERFLPLSMLFGEALDVGSLVFHTVMSLLMLAAAAVLCHFRRSESAGKGAPNGFLQHIYRTLFSLVPAVMAVNLAITLPSDIEFVFFFVLVGIVMYLVYELMTTKKLKKMLRCLPMIVFPVLLTGLYAASIFAANAYIRNRLPDASEVASISYENRAWVSYGDTYLLGEPITDPLLIKTALRDLAMELDEQPVPNTETATIRFQLKNGLSFERYFSIKKSVWLDFSLSEENLDTHLRIPTWDEFERCAIPPLGSNPYISKKDAERKQIWECFAAEYEALSNAEKMRVLWNENLGYTKESEWGSYYISATVYDEERSRFEGTAYVLSPTLTPKTVELVERLQYGSKTNILRTLEDIKNNHLEYGEFESVVVYPSFGDMHILDTSRFFACIRLDEHLFSESAEKVNVIFGGGKYSFWLALTESEREALKLSAS